MNERREDLLSLLDDPAAGPEDLGAVLDALDDLDGPSPFDPRAGWADLMARGTKRKPRGKRLGRVPLAAVIALVCLVTTAAAVTTLGLHDGLARYFGVGHGQGALVEKAVETPACSVTKDGVTISILQTMADQYGIYVLCEVVVPDSITLPEGAAWSLGWLTPTLEANPTGVQGGQGGQEILEQDAHRMLILSTFLPSDPIKEGPISFALPTLAYWNGQEEVVLAEGPWELEWELTQVEPGITLSPETPIVLDGWTPVITEITISPFSLHIYSDNTSLPDVPMALVFRDGSKLDIDPFDYDHVSEGAYLADEATGRQKYEFYYRFYDVIDPTQVTAVVIGETEIPVP